MSILDTIVEEKRREVARLPARLIAAGDLRDALLARGEPRDFLAALRQDSEIRRQKAEGKRHSAEGQTPNLELRTSCLVHQNARPALIAEVKKASPSAGVICRDFDPVRIAREYEAAGAACLSVLTDGKFFQGSLDHIRQIRAAVKLPLLRKDFVIDERQILEAIEWGADAVLLIVAILDNRRLQSFHALATGAGLAALVEVHDEAELDRALSAGAQLIGVNNRDLKTFKVDLATTERLARRLGESGAGQGRVLVAESGIRTRADVQRLTRCGVQAVLVGETLMRDGDVRAKMAELIH